PWEEALKNFEDALVLNARMGARPAISHTQRDYGRMLLRRGRAEDGAKARELTANAVDTYERALGSASGSDYAWRGERVSRLRSSHRCGSELRSCRGGAGGQLREERRRSHRVRDGGRGAVRRRVRLRVDADELPLGLGRAGSRHAHASRLVLAPDPVRQARDGPVRPVFRPR